MSKFVFSENMYGRKVKFLSDEVHVYMPEFYPAVGTVGTVVECYDNYEQKKDWKVQWPKGSTSRDGCWFCDEENVELIEEVDKQMTNEAIWEMLKPKMEKNGLKKKMGGLYIGKNLVDGFWVYSLDDVHNAIALAYKVGYMRSQKGRPFKTGEKKVKKQGGHWEPIDPENLPKEGTRVRYNGGLKGCNWKKSPEAKWIKTENDRFSIKFDKMSWPLDCVNRLLKYFDMWVEDDE